MSLLVPRHIAREVQAERNAQSDTPKRMSDAAFSDGQIREVIGRWDVLPIGQRIFVAPIVRDKTAGGIVVPDSSADMAWDGVVIAAGPLAFVHRPIEPTADEIAECMHLLMEAGVQSRDEYAVWSRLSQYRLQPGDKVNFVRWSGERVKRWHIDCPPLMVMNADDVIGLLKEMTNG